MTNVSGEEVFKILWVVTVLAFMIERALAVVFEHRLWLYLRERFHLKGLKEIAATVFAYYLCSWAGFDVLALMFGKTSSTISLLVTALIVAGGSKGAVKLMQDVLRIKRPTEGTAKARKR